MKIILIGSSGAMGQTLTRLLVASSDHEIIAGLQAEPAEADYLIATQFEDLDAVADQADVVIDFSSASLTDQLLDFVSRHSLPLLLATTGQTEAQETLIAETAKSVAILDSHNTSIGVNVMAQITQELSRILYPLGYDIEVIEKHHRYKVDAPSGTAKMLVAGIEAGMEEAGDLVYGRQGIGDPRQHQEIGVHAVRGGDIVGEHTVIFAGNQETLELTHRAGSKDLFAKGAMSGADFLLTAEPGLYSMADALGLD